MPTTTTQPPIGLIPKKFHTEKVTVDRFNEVRGAITRYYNAGLKIDVEWIEEYNELIIELERMGVAPSIKMV